MASPSPFARRRFLTDGPTDLVAPSADPVLLPALAALARTDDEAEVRRILSTVPAALVPVLVDRMAGRNHFAQALAVVLRIMPRERLSAIGDARLLRLYKIHCRATGAARPIADRTATS